MRKNPHYLIYASLLAALSILFGKFLAISIGTDIRISFENLPLFIVSVFMGPFWGAATAVTADLLGCVLRGYAIIPMITVAQALMGFLPGFLVRCVFQKTKSFPIAFSIVVTHLVVSVGIKTLILHFTYGMPLPALLGWRALTYLIIIPLETYLCVLLSRNQAIRKQFGLSDGSSGGKS